MVEFSVPVLAIVFVLVAGAAGTVAAKARRRSTAVAERHLAAELEDGPVPVPVRGSSPRVTLADPEAARWLDAAVRSLGARPIWKGEHIAQPLIATTTEDWLEIELDDVDAMAAPVPWVDVGGGRRWRLMRSTSVGQLPAATLDRPMPALTAVGDGLLVNLEGLGLLTIDGPTDQAMDLVRSIVHRLLTNDPGDGVDLRSTFPVTGIVARGLVCRRSPAMLMAEIPRWLDTVEERFHQRGAHHAYGHRLGGGEPMRPIVVITDPVGARDMPTVIEAAGQRRLPLAVVIVGGCAEKGEASIVFRDSDSAALEPWGLAFVPARRRPAGGRRLAELLDGCGPRRSDRRPRRPAVDPTPRTTGGERRHAPARPRRRGRAKQPAVAIGPEPPDWPFGGGHRRHRLRAPLASSGRPSVAPLPPLAATSAPHHEAAVESAAPARGDGAVVESAASVAAREPVVVLAPPAPASEPEIRVLGAIELDGIDVELTSQQLSLLTFIACHPAATRDAIIDALWDGQVISKSRFPNLLAETRRRLGRHRLPEASEGRYELAGVGIDLVRFEEGVDRAAAAEPQEAAELLRSALELVRGVPFTAPANRFWSWVNDHGHVAARVESTIADAAVRLAQFERDAGRLDDARWACERGLAASPSDQALVTVLAEIYVALGKPALATRLVDSWEERIARLDCGEPPGEPRRRLGGAEADPDGQTS